MLGFFINIISVYAASSIALRYMTGTWERPFWWHPFTVLCGAFSGIFWL